MAKERAKAETFGDAEDQNLSIEELNLQIARVNLQTAKLGLAEAKKKNEQFIDAEKKRHDNNKRRMSELQGMRNAHHAVIKQCKHKSGGSPSNVLKGGGRFSFSILTKAILPDGVSALLQCSRCRLLMYPPQKDGPLQLWFQTYSEEKKYYDALLEKSNEDGIEFNVTRGPTFMFKKNGVPIIPTRV